MDRTSRHWKGDKYVPVGLILDVIPPLLDKMMVRGYLFKFYNSDGKYETVTETSTAKERAVGIPHLRPDNFGVHYYTVGFEQPATLASDTPSSSIPASSSEEAPDTPGKRQRVA